MQAVLQPKTSARFGFTLLELLVTVGILAVLAAMAIPALSNMLPRYQVQGSARAVLNLAQAARLQANNTQKPVRLVIDCRKGSAGDEPMMASFAAAVYDIDGEISGWEDIGGSRREIRTNVIVLPAAGSTANYGGDSPDDVYWVVFLPTGRIISSHSPMRLSFTSDAAFMGGYALQVSISNVTGRVKMSRES